MSPKTWCLLVRHAHRDVLDRDLDNGLSEKGIRQADRIVQYLHDEHASRKPKQVLTSPKLRCVQTAKRIADAFKIEAEEWELLEERRPQESSRAFDQRMDELAEHIKTMDSGSVLVSHGDVIPELAQRLEQSEHMVAAEIKKGDVLWVFDGRVDRLNDVRRWRDQ